MIKTMRGQAFIGGYPAKVTDWGETPTSLAIVGRKLNTAVSGLRAQMRDAGLNPDHYEYKIVKEDPDSDADRFVMYATYVGEPWLREEEPQCE